MNTILTDDDRAIDAAARKIAECMDYPWEHMPEKGRSTMREHAKAVLEAALAADPEAPAQASSVDERAEFEAWAKRLPMGQTPLWREGDGYVYWQTEWEAWQARAALAQKVQA